MWVYTSIIFSTIITPTSHLYKKYLDFHEEVINIEKRKVSNRVVIALSHESR